MKKPRRKCPDADNYDDRYMPLCATEIYLACDSCVGKWQAAQAERVRRANKKPIERYRSTK